jgi:ABC-type nitrate/sulfonate/bicarbonate transport system substrate-binding protein
MAADKGYFREYGLDTQVLQITPPSDTNALINGEIQVDFDGSAGVNAIAGGAPIPFVAITHPTFTQVFYGQPSLALLDFIKSLYPQGVPDVGGST